MWKAGRICITGERRYKYGNIFEKKLEKFDYGGILNDIRNYCDTSLVVQ